MNKKLTYIFTLALLIINGMVMAQEAHVTIGGSVFGGGNKAAVAGNTKVTINQGGAKVAADVYGGGALANVGTDNTNTTIVNILNDTIVGNVYGGGLGDSLAPENGYNGSANIAALVHGKVYVNIGNSSGGPTLKGSVFGCNNINGTPLDSVFVNIYKTAHTTGDHNNQYPTGIATLAALEGTFPQNAVDSTNYPKRFAITAVYGGGNKASYKPAMNAASVSNPATPKCTTVHVFDCTENTIQTIYGGGNAANVGDTTATGDTIAANTRLIIEGGRYDQVFGGGNGYSETHNHTDPAQANYNPGANIFGTAVTQVQGGLYRQVFGGSNQFGDIDSVALSIDNQCTVLLIHESFGGANEADITSNVSTTLLCNNYSIGSFYGGSNKADINGNVTLNVRGGTYTNVFGGSKGTKPADGATSEEIALASADILGNVTLNLHGGTMENAFGGSDVFGSISGAITVNVWDTVTGCPLQVDTIYGGGQDAAYTPELVAGKKIVSPLVNLWNGTVGHGTVKGCVFGGGKGEGATVTAHPKVVIGDTISGHLAGNIITILNGNVFGGGNAATVDGIDSVLMLKANSVVSNLFGGGNAADADTAVVMMTVAASVDSIFGGGNLAGLDGTAMITVTKGTIRGGIYGGSNKEGTVKGDITINITDNDDDTENHTVIGASNAAANIHGGGYGDATRTNGHVLVNFGDTIRNGSNEEIHSLYPRVYGDIYGGSALGWVNDAGTDTTMVNILNGEIKKTTSGTIAGGNIYGGGLGKQQEGGDPSTAIAAKVNGKVFVNIGVAPTGSNTDPMGKAVIDGSVFGCNNLHGSPQDSVFVNIYQTAHGADFANNLYPPTPSSGTWTPELLATNAETQTYAIQSVFGGGNQASYTPVANRSTQVYVYGCENTIKDVFGGGNAANVGTTGEGAVSANTFILIDGGRINRVFGGGNGSPVAANIYGTATTTINAGLIDTIFGGSNMLGSITATSLNLDKAGDCDDEVFRVIYGGANLAPISSNLNTTINCGVGAIGEIYGGSNKATITGNVELNINGGTINYAYGGSKGDNTNSTDAWIDGNVQLNLYGGTVRHAFGGSNLLGNVKRQITVNVLDTVSAPCNLVLDTVYGGGNLAPYTPDNSNLSSPLVNIINGTVNKYVYGGGLGSLAAVTSNPVVNVGYDAATMATLLTPGATGSIVATGFSIPDTVAIVAGEVYGGGDAASVNGSTSVTLQKAGSSAIKLFGGGNQAGVSGVSTVTMNHGFVSNGVYGGCNTSGTVGGDITVNISGGTVGAETSRANVHGGGYGKDTKTGANVEVTIDSLPNFASPVIWGDVYGGSALGSVNSSTDEVNASKHTYVTLNKGTVNGDVYGGGLGQIANNSANPPVAAVEAKVWSPVKVTVIGGNVNRYNDGMEMKGGRVFGCNNLNGAPQVSTLVDIKGGTIEYKVFGGGNLANAGIGPHVVFEGGTTSSVYGGGAYAGTGPTLVDVLDGTIGNDVYGGCLGGGEDSNGDPYRPAVNGDVTVNIGSSTGGNVTFSDGSSVYGGNDAYGSPTGTATVNIYQTAHTTTNAATYREDDGVNGVPTFAFAGVYGGGNYAEFEGTESYVYVYGCENTISRVVGGGNAAATKSVHTMIEGGRFKEVFGGGNGYLSDDRPADVNGDVELEIHGGTIGQVFSAGNDLGSISGNITLNINKTTCDMYIGEVYGGGNKAASKAAGITIGCTGDWTTEGTNNHTNHNSTTNRIGYELEGIGTVYGGANEAHITSDITLNITSGIVDTVFGGNNTSGNIDGGIQVNINKTGDACNWYVGNVFGGGNKAAYTGTPDVNIMNGTVSGSVFGGGNKAGVGGGDVVMTDGTVLTGLYGGCNTSGTVTGDITVNVKGGIIGASGARANIHGGGYGENTSTTGNVTVNFGEASSYTTSHSDYPKLYGDVYGGSALGEVNSGPSNKTTVNILNGELLTNQTTSAGGFPVYNGGNVFGGGLGRKVATGILAAPAKVYGVVEVNIGGPSNSKDLHPEDDRNIGAAVIQGNIYGCNNTNGSPQDSVTVNIYRTFRTDKQQITYNEEDASYALHDVFGGGNEANYEPDATATNKKLKVYIHSCYNSIERTFSGSNAAAAGADGNIVMAQTVIEGGRFYNVFGGGNGEVSAADIYGDVQLEIHGGLVGEFYVGSNQNGSISGTSNVTVDQSSGCEDVTITEFYCGGKYADFVGDINATITCSQGLNVTNLYGGCKEADVVAGNGGSGNIHLIVKGGTYENVYGGSRGKRGDKAANIAGNVTLDLYGGTMENVYGGSNENGNISGTITVNIIDEESTCPLNITNIYGGSNETDYTPTNASAISPVVNLVHINNGVQGNVYGGSRGISEAAEPTKVVASPQVNIGYDASMTGLPATQDYNPANYSRKTVIQGNVFGGGDAAKVKGNTAVFLREKAKVMGNVYGGGNMAEVDGDTKVIVNGQNN